MPTLRSARDSERVEPSTQKGSSQWFPRPLGLFSPRSRKKRPASSLAKWSRNFGGVSRRRWTFWRQQRRMCWRLWRFRANTGDRSARPTRSSGSIERCVGGWTSCGFSRFEHRFSASLELFCKSSTKNGWCRGDISAWSHGKTQAQPSVPRNRGDVAKITCWKERASVLAGQGFVPFWHDRRTRCQGCDGRAKRPLTAREDGRYRPERNETDRFHRIDTNGEFTPLDEQYQLTRASSTWIDTL